MPSPWTGSGRRAVETLKEGREVQYGLLGIQADPNHTNRVDKVQRNTPASLGDLQVNDEIIAVNDVPVTDFDSLILAINVFPPGEPVRLKIRRADAVIEKAIVLAKFPVNGEIIATNRPRPWRGLRVDYSTGRNYQAIAPGFLEEPLAGVVVTEVEDGSPASSAGLRKGQLIQKVAKRPVPTPQAFAEAVEGQDGPVVLDTDHGTMTVGK